MRKSLEAIGLLALAVLFWITWSALYGPQPLPDRIPTHFNAAGQPNGWGPPATLWFLPMIGALLYGAMSVVARFPSSFNYPARVTPENRPRLEALALSMIAWIKTELVCLFALIQWSIVQAVRQVVWKMSPALVPLSIFVIFATIAGHAVAMGRAGNSGSSA
jgi:uncharacterized membrane protein